MDTPSGNRPARDAQISEGRITVAIPSDASPGEQLTLSVGQGTGLIEAAIVACEGAELCAGRPMVLFPAATLVVR